MSVMVRRMTTLLVSLLFYNSNNRIIICCVLTGQFFLSPNLQSNFHAGETQVRAKRQQLKRETSVVPKPQVGVLQEQL